MTCGEARKAKEGALGLLEVELKYHACVYYIYESKEHKVQQIRKGIRKVQSPL